MVGFLTPYATDGISYGFGFVFCGTNLAAGLMIYFFLYESKSLALEQVDVMYSQPDLKPWKSTKWLPEGYTDRSSGSVATRLMTRSQLRTVLRTCARRILAKKRHSFC